MLVARLRGFLLIMSILLVGTGWTFIKYVLSERERRLFVIVIPLQVRFQKEKEMHKLTATH